MMKRQFKPIKPKETIALVHQVHKKIIKNNKRFRDILLLYKLPKIWLKMNFPKFQFWRPVLNKFTIFWAQNYKKIFLTIKVKNVNYAIKRQKIKRMGTHFLILWLTSLLSETPRVMSKALKKRHNKNKLILPNH